MTGRRSFIAAICAGSFLLFLVQPMVARMALPRLGGAPAVWNSAMLVYQALLLAGYGYAHAIGRLQARTQARLHLVLFLAAALVLPIGLFAGDPPARLDPALWVLWLLGASIGPLFFVVAAQAPLLQRWYTLSGGDDPYPLYAASNLGSFAGLIAYPLVVEPFLTLRAQSLLWSAGYALLFFLVNHCATLLPKGEAAAGAVSARGPVPAWPIQLRWVLLAAVPSGLMLSTSLHLTTDIVAMPLLWVLPLGLYLLSFTIAFSAKREWATRLTKASPLLLILASCTAVAGLRGYPVIVAGATLVALFVLSVALHARMYDLRPAPTHLTRFYLAMSFGGMLGGLFCALIAPLLFDWSYEHPLLLIAAALMLDPPRLVRWTQALWSTPARAGLMAVVLLIGGALLSLVGEGVLLAAWQSDMVKAFCVVILIVMAIVAIGRGATFAAILAYLMLCLGGWQQLALSITPGVMTRSYFGIYVVRNNGTDQRVLVHGTTVHGIQNLAQGQDLAPTSYYAPRSGVGIAMRAAPDLVGAHARIGVVGLGAGTLACYIRPGQHWRFYEIDAGIARIARDPKSFTFLSRCQPKAPIELGDARITLAREPAASADLLVIDAFSSDAVPMHLLTREALALYTRHLSPEGVLLIHISNRFVDLRPVLIAGARANGLSAALRIYKPGKTDAARNYAASTWVAMAHDPRQIDRLMASSQHDPWQRLDGPATMRAWTDDYGSILPLLKIWKKTGS